MTDHSSEGSGEVPHDEPADRIRSDRPLSARVWGYLLGSKANFAADREVGDMILETFPDFALLARLQRRFLARAVRFLAGEAAIRQFLDIGSGLPTVDNTHEVAQRVAPESRIVYVDNDPLVQLHSQALLTSTPEGKCDYIDGDVRAPEPLLEKAAETLDFDQPIALTMLGIMGQLPDSGDPWGITRRLLDALPAGSYLALSDGTNTNAALNKAVETYNASSANSYHLRPPDQIARFFDGLELVAPGIVPTPIWQRDTPVPAEPPTSAHALCGVARQISA
ncbi:MULTISPECIES: SAM-dependent methyltransferase [Actinomadura]|uniref:SAM-dependent methyltransferase n=1 Tax=Actinomadura yumaensis TaxID=111807 RepID=A0ABW2CI10_9ACTN|nr:SAM-dependent methyltransferase [Actinomadura sp. J1-007]MWK37075.1 SAM-dependent methyltransferase [Actinomadura sp. J1-007]